MKLLEAVNKVKNNWNTTKGEDPLASQEEKDKLTELRSIAGRLAVERATNFRNFADRDPDGLIHPDDADAAHSGEVPVVKAKVPDDQEKAA